MYAQSSGARGLSDFNDSYFFAGVKEFWQIFLALSLSYGFVTVKENEELTEGLNIIEKLVTFFMFVAY